MGNINYKDLTCDNYYCQSVSFKPEWFSESAWVIEYEKNEKNEKPYIIDKGILKIRSIEIEKIDNSNFELLLSKKLLINFNDIRNITIPINFRYKLDNEVDILIIFSNSLLSLKNIKDLNSLSNDMFFINLKLSKKKN